MFFVLLSLPEESEFMAVIVPVLIVSTFALANDKDEI